MAEGVEEHRLFVGGLDDDTALWELESAFSVHGEVFNVSLNAGRGYGFVSFYHKHEAENAMEEMHGKYIGRRPMRVEWAFGWPRESSEDSDDESDFYGNDYDTVYHQSTLDNTTVYCGGLSEITRDLLERTFGRYGEIEEITCFDDSRNYAFIRFRTHQDAALAICGLNDTIIDDEVVTCSWARNPQVLHSTPHFELGTPSTSSESSHSSSPNGQDNFDTVLSMTTPNNRTVYVGGLPMNVSEDLVRNAFSSYGDIEDVKLFTEVSNYGFVRFTTKVSAALAICACDDKLVIDGETIRCNWSFRTDDDPPDAVQAPIPSTSNTCSSLPVQPEAASCPTSVPDTQLAATCGLASVVECNKGAVGATVAKEKKVDLLCKICMDEQVGVVFLPCGHLASCPRCAQRISDCPLCRKRITGKVRTYLS